MSMRIRAASGTHSGRRKYAAWCLQTLLLATQLLAGARAFGANPGTAPAPPQKEWFKRLHIDGHIDHGSEGSITTESSVRIATEGDIEQAGKYPISYDSRLQKLTILDAYTEKPDGTRIPVERSEIVRQAGIAGTGDAASYSDISVDVVPFPQVAKGDIVTIRYRVSGDLSWLDGMLSASMTATGSSNAPDARMTMDVPSNETLHADLNHFTEQVDRHGDRTLYAWTYAGGSSAYNGTFGAVDTMTSIPHVYTATIGDYDTLGRIYWQHAQAPAAPTARTQALAKQITHGHTDPREKAAAIYDWVRANIRYVASYAGIGAWVPRPADEVLRTGYGDCKDHVALFQALLRSVGIDSDPVLLRADKTNYVLPSVPITDAFNHVITYLPSLDLYADTTVPEVPFGVLPYVDTGKPALLAGERVGLTRTPLATASDMTETRSTQITVQADGSAQVETVVTASGVAANDLRSRARQLGAPGDGKWVKAALHIGRYDGLADYAFRLPSSANAPAREWVRSHVTRFLQSTHGAVYLNTLPAASGPVVVSDSAFNVYQPAGRSQPYWCAPRQLEEHMTIDFPDNVTVVPPANADISGEGISWHAAYVTKPHQLTVTRTFRIDSAKMDCPAADYRKQKAVVDRIVASFSEQAVYLPSSERTPAATASK